MENFSSACLSELILHVFVIEIFCFLLLLTIISNLYFFLQIRILINSLGLLVITCQSFEFFLSSTGRGSSHDVETDWKAGSEQCPGARLE